MPQQPKYFITLSRSALYDLVWTRPVTARTRHTTLICGSRAPRTHRRTRPRTARHAAPRTPRRAAHRRQTAAPEVPGRRLAARHLGTDAGGTTDPTSHSAICRRGSTSWQDSPNPLLLTGPANRGGYASTSPT